MLRFLDLDRKLLPPTRQLALKAEEKLSLLRLLRLIDAEHGLQLKGLSERAGKADSSLSPTF